MKTHKLTKIFGIGLSLILLVSMLAIAAPVMAKDPGAQAWSNGSEPGSSGLIISRNSDVTDAAVGSDGVVYIADVYNDKVKRSSTGNAMSSLNNYNATGGNPKSIAVAPDNSDCVAVVDTVNAVHISNDAGVTWSSLPALSGAYLGSTIMDITIGAARSGTLLGREYAIALADPNAGATATGGAVGALLIIGSSATWTEPVTGLAGTRDFTTVKFSPNYAGDRVLLAIGANATGGVYLYLINVATGAQLGNSPVNFTGAGTATVDYVTATAGNSITASDIAVASDFDPTDSNAYRAWVSVASGAAATDDVYRVDGPSARDLNAVTAATAIDSIAYSGTNDAGTLFVGYISGGTSIVKRTASPQNNTPTWTTTKTQPTGYNAAGITAARVVIKCAPDFGTTNRVYAGTSANESAWNVSDDGGVSFQQRSYIDNNANSNVTTIAHMTVSSDGSSMWWVTNDYKINASNNTALGDMHVWMSPSMPTTAMSYKRMYTVIGVGTNATILALNPDWETSPSVFVLDTSPAGNDVIYVSHNAGKTWTTMQGPAAGTDTLVAADANTLYATNGNNFYKSTNAGWTWEPAVAWYSSGTGQNIHVTDSGKIFIGRTSGIVRMSTNGGASWASQGTTGYPSQAMFALPDENYDVEGAPGEGILYRMSLTTGIVYRYDKNDGTGLVNSMNTPAAGGTPVALIQKNGVLYAVNSVDTVRLLNPRAALANITAGTWENMDQTAAVLAEFVAEGGVSAAAVTADNELWVSGGNDIWGYVDFAATAAPVITSPVNGYVNGVDPVNGRGNQVTIAFDPIGSGTAAVNSMWIQVSEVATGWGASIIAPAAYGITAASPSVSLGTGATIGVNLLAGTEYQIRARINNQLSTDAIRSAWSDTVTFKVESGGLIQAPQAGAQILGPAGGSTTTLSPGFSWAPVSGATEYEFILATDAAMTQTLAGTPTMVASPAFSLDSDLDYSTTYFWAVKSTQPSTGVQSIGTFTTMAEPTEATPIVIEQPTGPATEAAPAIPAAAVWAVIVIGAVLVVAVLVLIVRTRRPL
jgi:trimeric autotransporter adhesin